MTYRERQLAKAARLREWAAKRESKAEALIAQNAPYLRFAFQPRCSHVGPSGRCQARATVYLHAPDGLPVPGGYECAPCAEAVIAEYRDKLGEEWSGKPLILA